MPSDLTLPNEMYAHIMFFSDKKSLGAMREVSKDFNALATRELKSRYAANVFYTYGSWFYTQPIPNHYLYSHPQNDLSFEKINTSFLSKKEFVLFKTEKEIKELLKRHFANHHLMIPAVFKVIYLDEKDKLNFTSVHYDGREYVGLDGGPHYESIYATAAKVSRASLLPIEASLILPDHANPLVSFNYEEQKEEERVAKIK